MSVAIRGVYIYSGFDDCGCVIYDLVLRVVSRTYTHSSKRTHTHAHAHTHTHCTHTHSTQTHAHTHKHTHTHTRTHTPTPRAHTHSVKMHYSTQGVLSTVDPQCTRWKRAMTALIVLSYRIVFVVNALLVWWNVDEKCWCCMTLNMMMHRCFTAMTWVDFCALSDDEL